jgi:hypothetical protein
MDKKEFYEKLRDRLNQEIWGDQAELKLVQRLSLTNLKKNVGNNLTAEQMNGVLLERIKLNEERLSIVNDILNEII